MPKTPATPKLPKSLAACADELFSTREERLAIQKQVDALAARESVLREHIIAHLPKSDATGIAGKLARVTVIVKPKPTVEDWELFYAHVKKTGHFDLMQRRLSEAAVAERWADGKAVPGIGAFNVVTLSVNRV